MEKTKRKPKPLILSQPPNIPAPREPIPITRPLGELDVLAANFQYISERVSDVTIYNDLPPNAHEFLTRTQQSINHISGYVTKVKSRDLKEYREILANHQIALVCKISFVGILTVCLCGVVSSFQKEVVYVQPNPDRVQSSVSLDGSNGSQLYPP